MDLEQTKEFLLAVIPELSSTILELRAENKRLTDELAETRNRMIDPEKVTRNVSALSAAIAEVSWLLDQGASPRKIEDFIRFCRTWQGHEFFRKNDSSWDNWETQT